MSIETDKLIKDYNFGIATPDCLPEAQAFRIVVQLNDDISEVLPYINALFDNTEYYHDTKILLWEYELRRYALRPFEIAVIPVNSREEALLLIDETIDRINDIWNRRNEIEPSFEGKKTLPNVLDIFKLLPGTNCKECDYATCMAYAAALREGKAELTACRLLLDDIHKNNRDSIEQLFK